MREPRERESRAGEPRVLELRVHGVRNTPPADVLGLPPAEIERADGDELGSFWVPLEQQDPAVRREAYSWGALARTGGGALAGAGRIAVQLGWLLVLPFGLANVAYWMREIPDQRRDNAWRGGRGSATLRIFSLGLTLLLLVTLATVVLDLVGVQCFAANQGQVCAQLPAVLDPLGDLSRAARLAALSLVPLGAVLLVYLLARRGRVRFEANIFREMTRSEAAEAATSAPRPSLLDRVGSALGMRATPRTGTGPGAGRGGATGVEESSPLLGHPGFWTLPRIARTSEQLHLASCLLALAALLGWDRLFASGSAPACADPAGFSASGCLARAWRDHPVSIVLLAAVAVLFVVVVLLVGVWAVAVSGAVIRRRRAIATATLALSVALYLAILGWTAWPEGAARPSLRSAEAAAPHFLGLVITPLVLVGVLVAIAVSALGWRRGVPTWWSNGLIIAGLVIVVLRFGFGDASPLGTPTAALTSLGGIVVLLLGSVALAPRLTRAGDLRHVGWSGMGPGVVLLLALAGSLVLSAILAVGVTAWLNLPAGLGTTDSPGMWRTPAGTVPRIEYPGVYVGVGVGLLNVVLVMLVAGLVLAIRHLGSLWRLTTPSLIPPGETAAGLPAYQAGPTRFRGDRDVDRTLAILRSLDALRARRTAALAHRAEPLLGLTAAVAGIGLTAAVAFASPDVATLLAPLDSGALATVVAATPRIASTMLALAATTLVAVVVRHALSSGERPLGLLWDLVCFLPRAGHPFGPPCYSERVVPELNSRIRGWLVSTPQHPVAAPEGRRVVISAHSLGGVLAVASLLSLAGQRSAPISRVSLLTYGVQLRPFFGRFFPDLLGPAVLGTPGCLAPGLFSRDPWLREVRATPPFDAASAPAGSVVGLLRDSTVVPRPAPVGWLSLWRRTDPLGFPACGYGNNPIDRGASEYESSTYLTTIATHGRYPDTPQYTAAFATLARPGRKRPASSP